MGVLGTLSNPSQVKPSPSPISVKFEKAPTKKASIKKPPKMKTSNKKASQKKQSKQSPAIE